MGGRWHHRSLLIAIFNTSEQSSAFNHEYVSWASEPKARTPTVQVIKCTFAHTCCLIFSMIKKNFSTTYLAPSIHKLSKHSLSTSVLVIKCTTLLSCIENSYFDGTG
jgi:hypothetical protein